MDVSSLVVGPRSRTLAATLAAVTMGLAIVAPRPAGAQALGTDQDPPGLDCLTEARGTLGASPSVTIAGQLSTLSWSVQAPSSCGAMRVEVDNLTVTRTGSRTVDAIERTSAVYEPTYVAGSGEVLTPGFLRTHYVLRAIYGSATRTLATTNVDVQLPVDPGTGRPRVTITADHQVPLLLLGLKSRRALVFVQNQVALDLTGYDHVYIASGVQLIGGRTAREPGPLLYVRCTAYSEGIPFYCTSAPNALFIIHGDVAGTVRITGIRLQGVDLGIAAESALPHSHGIVVTSALNVQIDNSELSGWRSSAIRVTDELGRICHVESATCGEPNSSTVRILRNYIHHNQQDGTDGYGVEVVNGAYALIEKNVFDYNRHAIASDGEPDTGYLAYRNLVLEHGGEHEHQAGLTFYTHQFDMHGTRTCSWFSEWDCGDGGEYVDIRFNSFFYTRDNAFKLRGTPRVGVDVVSNVFANATLTVGTGGPPPALGGYTEHIQAADNLVAVNENGHYGRCDFDRDGVDDLFLATGQTWWFNSGGAHHWVYLNTSRARLGEIQLGDVDGDGRCDVVANGVVSSGGTGGVTKRIADLVWRATAGSLANWEMSGGAVAAQTTPGTVPSTWQLAGRADLRADGRQDLVWRDDAGQLTLWQMAGGYKVGEARTSAPGYTFQGAGDFDADGADDLLWRDGAGALVIWLRGERVTRVSASLDPTWTVAGVGDVDGDGRADILWRHAAGALVVWHMVGRLRVAESVPEVPGAGVRLAGVADFDADGIADVLWRDAAGTPSVRFGGTPGRVVEIAAGAYALDAMAEVLEVRDYTRDGRADILWRDSAGRLVVWVLAAGRFVRAEYPRQPLRGWALALEEGTAITRGGTDPTTDPDLPLDCLKRCL